MPWSRSRISFRNAAYSLRVCTPICGDTRMLSAYMSLPAATVWESWTKTAKNAAVAGAVPVTLRVAMPPAAMATPAGFVFAMFVPAALYHQMPRDTAPSAAGAYTSAAAETMSPGRTGCPLVPPGLWPCQFPAPPAAVISSEWEPSVGHLPGSFGSSPDARICRPMSVLPMIVPAMGWNEMLLNPADGGLIAVTANVFPGLSVSPNLSPTLTGGGPAACALLAMRQGGSSGEPLRANHH